ncbi:uncharacterized protein TRAVEDRAFT_40766 [Trametes versicolor FP-101664 SS1]|uniref:Uncharacterized protein n=1 Tax=Trametes versicolor (strain FP-101664) TaxID=717944 RepID=R7S7E4_TRAVS|nr:uncharacterized protein TRAVEDRAFT_40766 [Trametes versicolor FP-101664 SS1]EIW51958.1 hypothetical protein TRAVEDRAFT_40766 [Trametes versicolor FP-101664 SS1]
MREGDEVKNQNANCAKGRDLAPTPAQPSSSNIRRPAPTTSCSPLWPLPSPFLGCRPCDANGGFIPRNQPPEPLSDDIDWSPFPDRPSYEFAELIFEDAHLSKAKIDHILLNFCVYGCAGPGVAVIVAYGAIYTDYKELLETIDNIELGPAKWRTFAVRYGGPVDADSPPWKREVFLVHARNPLHVAEALAASPDFKERFDVAPFEEYTGPGRRRVSNLMSGSWAYKQADKISEDPQTHGSMLAPIILGADKTTVSVATGNQEFHPLYMSLGNIHNDMRRAHRESVVPIAFLAIPKAEHEWEKDEEFRVFKKQLYHGSIAKILEPLRPGMTTPHVLKCPDGHYRRTIFELGPFIADYPEQVFLSGVVSGWCPRCHALPTAEFVEGAPRFREHDDALEDAYGAHDLWHVFGINSEVKPFTALFPRADIHELLTPDLLHQLIKGTFKDHIVAWVVDYVKMNANSEREADRILDDIDHRLAAVPSFPGLRRFPQGRNFKQWTGNDSKALMKVFLPAIVGYVPEKMVQCIAALLDFCYLARRSAHDTFSLRAMDELLEKFHQLRTVFEEVGIRPDGFALPRQHALVHYVRSIQLFGSPNGLCSSITESRHISAVKKPWRDSSRNNPLGQIIRKNTRLSKLAAARVEFGRRNMFYGDVLTHAYLTAGLDAPEDKEDIQDERFRDLADAIASDDAPAESLVTLSERPAYVTKINELAATLARPQLLQLIRRFLYLVQYPDAEPDNVLDADLAWFWECEKASVYYSATAVFYAPSEHAGPHGMHRELIRSNPSWYGADPRYDTVLVCTNQDAIGMDGMVVARVRSFFSFSYDGTLHSCALVEWFILEDDTPDDVTGMWVVRPEMDQHGEHVTDVISVGSIVRACHLIPVYGTTRVPVGFSYTDTLDAFRRYYVNWYADYHAHETIT